MKIISDFLAHVKLIDEDIKVIKNAGRKKRQTLVEGKPQVQYIKNSDMNMLDKLMNDDNNDIYKLDKPKGTLRLAHHWSILLYINR